jgi:hypothetical protein
VTGFNRHEAKVRLVTLIVDALSDPSVVVQYALDPRTVTTETIWLGPITGESTPSALRSGRKHYDDVFVIPVFVAVHGDGKHRTAESAGERVQVLAQAVHDCIADGYWLQVPGDVESLPGVWAATVSWVNGPDAMPDTEFHGQAVELAVTISSRIT